MKTCNICKTEKPLDEFGSNKSNKYNDGKQYYCKICANIKSKQVRDSNPAYIKQYQELNRDKIKERFTPYINDYNKKRRLDDPLFRLKLSIRTLVHRYLTEAKKSNTESIVGCSFQELKQYLESKWSEGMNWDNYGVNGWHIDHIIPLASALNEKDIYRLNHYSNLQPLWGENNRKKGKKYIIC